MKKMMRLLCKLLGIGGIGMFFLAGALNFGIGWNIGLVMIGVAVLVALVLAMIEGDGGDKMGSYRIPRI